MAAAITATSATAPAMSAIVRRLIRPRLAGAGAGLMLKRWGKGFKNLSLSPQTTYEDTPRVLSITDGVITAPPGRFGMRTSPGALGNNAGRGKLFSLSRVKGVKSPEGVPFYYVKGLSDDHLLADDAFCFPVRLKPVQKKSKAPEGQNDLFEKESPVGSSPMANLSPAARAYLATMGLTDPDADPETAGLYLVSRPGHR